MKLKTFSVVCILLMVGDVFCTYQQEHDKRQAAAAVGTMLLETFGDALVPQIEKFTNALGDWLIKKLFGDSPYQVVLGRSVKVDSNGNVASIKDISTGVTVVGQGNSPQEAMAMATNKLIVTLYQGGFISIDDLHLAPIRTTTLAPCGDAFPVSYCTASKSHGFCSPQHASYSFVYEHCLKTCTGC